MDNISSKFASADPFESWWPFIVAIAVGVLMTVRAIMGGQWCPNGNLINDQIVIVTGSSGGIGLEIVKGLCARSARVIMACKDTEKAEKEMKRIKAQQSDANVEVRYVDMKSFDCVKRFVRTLEKDIDHVDILINNAGVIFNATEKTVDYFEMHLQVNYLSPFLLSILLLPLLKKSEHGRIINTAAHAYSSAKMTIEDPLNIGSWAVAYHHREAFARSKLAVILSTRYMAKVLKESGSPITVNAYTPGFVRGTDHLRKSPVMNALCAKVMTYPWMWIFMKSPIQGAQTAIYMSTEPSLQSVTGAYFNDCEKSELTSIALDDDLAKKLFAQSLNVLKLDMSSVID